MDLGVKVGGVGWSYCVVCVRWRGERWMEVGYGGTGI